MATKLYDLIVSVSTYQDNNGQNKHRWENVGSVLQDKDQQGNTYSYIMFKATFNPAGIQRKDGSDSIRITLVKPKDKNNTTQQGYGQQSYNSQPQFDPNPQFGDNISDVPF